MADKQGSNLEQLLAQINAKLEASNAKLDANSADLIKRLETNSSELNTRLIASNAKWDATSNELSKLAASIAELSAQLEGGISDLKADWKPSEKELMNHIHTLNNKL